MVIVGSRSIENLKTFELFSSIEVSHKVKELIRNFYSNKKWTNPRNLN